MGNKIWETGLNTKDKEIIKGIFKQLTSIFSCFDVCLTLHFSLAFTGVEGKESERASGILSAGHSEALLPQDTTSLHNPFYIPDSFFRLPDLYTILTCFWNEQKLMGLEKYKGDVRFKRATFIRGNKKVEHKENLRKV